MPRQENTSSPLWRDWWHKERKRDSESLLKRRALFERASFILSQEFLPREAPCIYDLGCSDCEVSKYLLLELPRSSLVAVDWNADALKAAEHNLSAFAGRYTLSEADCTSPAFLSEHRGKADIILSLGVVEHFKEPERILKDMAPLLKPGGVLVLMVPNRLSPTPWSRRWMQLRGTWFVGLQVEYTPTELQRWCESAGLEVVSKVALPRAYFPYDTPFIRTLGAIDRLFARLIPEWGWYAYAFARAPRPA